MLIAANSTSRSSITDAVRRVVDDSLYRNSMLLIANSGILAVFGLAFWTIASRVFTTRDVGTTSALIGATLFASTAVGLGLPNVVMRFLATERDQRGLVRMCCNMTVVCGAALAIVWWAIPGHLGVPLEELAHSRALLPLVMFAVIVPAVSNIADSAIVARRESQYVLVKNLVGSITKVIAVPLAVGWGVAGLFGAYLLSALVATIVALAVLRRRWIATTDAKLTPLAPRRGRSSAGLEGRMSFALGNHVGVLVAILPISTLPIIVLWKLGAVAAAYVSIPMMIVALLNVIPSMTAQSLFAELSAQSVAHAVTDHGVNDGDSQRIAVAKALKAIYALAVPAIVVTVAVAPLLLSTFGPGYARAGTPVLRLLALAAVFACFNYVADTVLIARSLVAGYTFLNVSGTVAAMALPVALLSRGLTGFGVGWLLGQAVYAALAVATLAFYRTPRLNQRSRRNLIPEMS